MIAGQEVEFMVDSGLMVNLIPGQFDLDLGLEVVNIQLKMSGVGGGQCDITEVVEFSPLKIGRFTGPIHLFVSPKAKECILGQPFLFDYGCNLGYKDTGELLTFEGKNG